MSKTRAFHTGKETSCIITGVLCMKEEWAATRAWEQEPEAKQPVSFEGSEVNPSN